MNETNTKKLFKDFPKLYPIKHMSKIEPLVRLGFEFRDGWFKLVYELSEKISKLDPEGIVRAEQVKEKIGGLRFYTYTAPQNISD